MIFTNFSVLIALLPDLADHFDSLLLGPDHDRVEIFDREGHVLDAIAVLRQMGAHLLRFLRVRLIAVINHYQVLNIIKKQLVFSQPRFEHKDGVLLLDGVGGHPPLAGLQALVGVGLEPEADAIVRGGLLSIADPPLDMVEGQELALFGLGTL